MAFVLRRTVRNSEQMPKRPSRFSPGAVLEMQHAVADLLGSTLVPELGTDVTARATGDIHLLLVTIAAIGALPHQLAVILDNLDLTVVAAHTWQ